MQPPARRGTAIAIWLVGLAACIWISLGRTTFNTDLTAFLPASATPAQELLMAQLRDGIASRLILVAIEGGEPEALAAASKRLARALVSSGEFGYVANGEEALAREDREFLFKHRYALSPGVVPERFTQDGLHEALAGTLQALASPLGAIVRRGLANDPTGELTRVLAPMAERPRPPVQNGVWISSDGKRALLMAETKAAGFDPVPQERAQGAITTAFDTVRAESAATGSLRLIMSGPAVFALQSRDAIEHDAWFLSIIATGLVIAILALAYRSGVLVLFGLVPVITGVFAAIAAVSLAFGSVHGITLGFGATLIGEAVDYPTYLFTQRAPGEPARQAVQRIWPTLRLAVLTTVFGSLAMLLSSFVGLAQLGLFSLAGVLVAGLVTRYLLPEIVPDRFAGGSALPAPRALFDWVEATRPLRSWVIVVLLVSIGFLFTRHGDLWESDITRLNPIPERSKLLDGELRDQLGAPDVRVILAVSAATEEAVLAKCEALAPALQRLIDEGLLQRYESPAFYLPSKSLQAERRAALPPPGDLRARLTAALRDSPFRDDQFGPFLEDVERARTSPDLSSADLQGTAWGLAVRAYLVRQSGRVIALLPLAGVRDPRALGARVAALDDPALFAFNLQAESNAMISAYRNQSLWLGLLGVIAIAAVLAIGLRQLRGVIAILVPVLAAMCATAALLAFMQVKLSVFHLVSLLLVLGIGVNYALFFNREWREDAEHLRTAFSVLIASLTTVCAFGALIASETPILRSIGSTVALGAVLSLVFSAAWARVRSASGTGG